METFLVSGAAGFIGQSLIKSLLSSNHNVVGIDIKDIKAFSDDIITNERFTFIKHDLTENLTTSINSISPEINGIFHLASCLPNKNFTYDNYAQGNIDSTINLLNFAKNHASVKFFLLTSTGSVFGEKPQKTRLDEKCIPVPKSYYGLTKLVAERLIEIELLNSHIKGIVIRFTAVFGPKSKIGIVNTFYESLKNNSEIELFSEGKRFRNLLYIDDAVSCLKKVSENYNNFNGFESFIIGSPNSLKVYDIATCIRKELNSSSKIKRIKKYPATDWDVFINISKAKKLLGFNPMKIEKALKVYLKERANEI